VAKKKTAPVESDAAADIAVPESVDETSEAIVAVEPDEIVEVETDDIVEVEADDIVEAEPATTAIEASGDKPPNVLAIRVDTVLAQFRRKVVWIPVVAVIVLALIGTAGAMVWQRQETDRKAKVAAAAAAATAAAKARDAAQAEKNLLAQFEQIMVVRGSIMAADAKSADAVAGAKAAYKSYNTRVAARNRKVKRLDAAYNKEYQRVDDWNHDMTKMGYLTYPSSPSYPDEINAPSFSSQIKALKSSDLILSTATAKLLDLTPDPQFADMLAQLKEACKTLSDQALHNADTLTTAVDPATGGDMGSSGYLDKKVFATLHANTAKAILTLANNHCLTFIADHKLDIRLYDVAGGRDVNPKDSSMLTSVVASGTAQ